MFFYSILIQAMKSLKNLYSKKISSTIRKNQTKNIAQSLTSTSRQLKQFDVSSALKVFIFVSLALRKEDSTPRLILNLNGFDLLKKSFSSHRNRNAFESNSQTLFVRISFVSRSKWIFALLVSLTLIRRGSE